MTGFVHLELNTDNTKRAKSFYSKVFGWKYADMKMPEGIYTGVTNFMNPGAALHKKPMDAMPSQWIPYVGVDDVKKTVATAKKAGAQVTVPYFKVDGFGEGAWLIDPTGAPIAIWHSFPAAAPAAKKKAKKKAAKKKAAKKKAAKKAPKKKAAKKKVAKKKGKRGAKKKAA